MSNNSIALPLPSCTRSSSPFFRVFSVRFSLRELLLFMLACAAFAGSAHLAYEKQRALRPTHVAEYFVSGLERDVAEARAVLGEEG